jgi:hypothetical protein
MCQGISHGKVAFTIDREIPDLMQVGAHQKLSLSWAYGSGATEVVVPARRREPVAKTGGFIVHSLVIAVLYHSLVCSCKNVNTMMDNTSSHGNWHVRSVRKWTQLAITASHDGDFLNRDR